MMVQVGPGQTSLKLPPNCTKLEVKAFPPPASHLHPALGHLLLEERGCLPIFFKQNLWVWVQYLNNVVLLLKHTRNASLCRLATSQLVTTEW